MPFCIVPLRDAAALARTHVDRGVWAEHLEHTDAAGLFPIAPLDDDLHRWRARMYAPSLGIAEDPAIEQGVEMGRPSELRVARDQDGGEASAVLVGGDAVVVGEGAIEVPPEP